MLWRIDLSLLALTLLLVSPVAKGQWRAEGAHRAQTLARPRQGTPGFSAVSAEITSIWFTNQVAESRSLTNQVYLNGSGLAAGDVDGDGRCDLYFCGLDNRNELYRNLGNWRFDNVTDRAGVACADQASTGAAFVDVDGDGDLDLLVNGIGRGTRLFLNDGRGSFTEATAEYGLTSKSAAMSLALADIDGDGYVDLYIVNYRTSTVGDEPEKRFRVNSSNGRYEISSVDGRATTEPDLVGRFTFNPSVGVIENGEPDVLYRNVAGKRFERVSWTDGAFKDREGRNVQTPFDWGLSAMFHDVDGDGAPDLYVCNDFQSEDRLWINSGKGQFYLATEGTFRHISFSSMGVDFADIDGDGRDEMFVADMLSREHARRQTQIAGHGPGGARRAPSGRLPQYPRNTLFWNSGDSTFAEIGQLGGVGASEWSWCPAFLDVDLDGYADLIITAGHWRDVQNMDVNTEIEAARKQKLGWRQLLEMRRRFPRLAFPLIAFRNNGDLTFAFKQAEWGFTSSQVAQGMALADLDNDGDLDVVVNCLNGPALLYRNNCSANRLAIRLKGKSPNTGAIGARIMVEANGMPQQSQELTSGGRYLSGDDLTRSFAVGNATEITVRVRWRGGMETTLSGVRANQFYEISEDGPTARPAAPSVPVRPLFDDVSEVLNHVHQDQPFDDFQRQPLLPRKFSGLGPGATWRDLDGDGWEDLIIGSGKSGRIAVYQNDSGHLKALEIPELSRPAPRDCTTILGWRHGTNQSLSLLLGSANYEDGLTNVTAVRQFRFENRSMDDSFPGFPASAGPLAMADVDGDGDLDLFVGARVMAARYPEPCSSKFFRNDRGSLVLDAELSRAFDGVGLVSAATWSDLDNNGKPELILACDGGPIRIFSLRDGRFIERTDEFGLTNWTGAWNSVATGDFDNDGRLDIVAGNWGRNTQYQEYLPDGYYLYYAPSGSSVSVIEACRDSKLGKIVPLDDREALEQLLPSLSQRYPTFASFSTTGIIEILGDELPRFREVRFHTFDSTVFLNHGTNFVARPLPTIAQFSPVFGIAVGDVDADGNEDIFLAQNFFALKENSRFDAGRGLLLLGDGTGKFTPASTERSGLAIDGEGRGAAFCDYDHDGKLDLVVAQNSSRTRLFHNNSPRDGMRVLLRGETSNPSAVGASVRLQYANGTLGARHEIHAGEGYWSQADGAIVLGHSSEPSALQVTWPSGKIETVALAAKVREVVVRWKE
jgi:hypothetical protein